MEGTFVVANGHVDSFGEDVPHLHIPKNVEGDNAKIDGDIDIVGSILGESVSATFNFFGGRCRLLPLSNYVSRRS